MKKVSATLILLFLLSACGSGVDDEALKKISGALENRWEYTESLGERITIENLETATQIELDELPEYEVDEFKDVSLYVLYDNYRRQLNLISSLLIGADISSTDFAETWERNMDKRAKHLYDINLEYDLNISSDYEEIFNDVLASSTELVEAEKVEKELEEISGLSDHEVIIDGNSAAIIYPTESVLTVDSFVARKVGFPSNAMDILETMKDHEYENIVIATTNQETIAISSYFTKETLNNIDFSAWDNLDSYDAHKFYELTDAYNIRNGIWGQLEAEIQQSIGSTNKQDSNEFWNQYGFSH